MATTYDVLGTWLNPASVSLPGDKLRRADSAGFAGAGSALGVSGGVVRHGDTSLAVTVDASDVVTVQAGAVVIPGMPGLGCYRSSLNASITLNPTARNATNPRIDLIVFQMLDHDALANGGTYTGRVSVIAGTPAATPSAPALPSMAVELARITLPQTGGGAATVDSTHRTYTSAVGGTIPVPTVSMLPAAAATGQRAIALDTLVIYTWNGSTWLGGWIAFTPGIYTQAAPTTAVASSPNADSCKYRWLDGKTVTAQGSVTITNAQSAPYIALPFAAKTRQLNIGTGGLFGTGAPSGQSFIGYMDTSATKLVCAVDRTNGYLDAAAGNVCRYSVTYEIA